MEVPRPGEPEWGRSSLRGSSSEGTQVQDMPKSIGRKLLFFIYRGFKAQGGLALGISQIVYGIFMHVITAIIFKL